MQLRTRNTGASYSAARQVFSVCAMTVATPIVRRNVRLARHVRAGDDRAVSGRQRDRIGHGVRHERMADVAEDRRRARRREPRPRPVAPAGAERGDAERRVDLAGRRHQAQERRRARAKRFGSKVGAGGVEQEEQIQVFIDGVDDVVDQHHHGARAGRQHERIAADPARDRLEPAKGLRVGPQRADERAIAGQELELLSGRDHGSDLPERRRRPRYCAGRSGARTMALTKQEGDQRREQRRREQHQDRHRHGGERQHGKDEAPARHVGPVAARQPPEVIAVRIVQPRERQLRAFPRAGIARRDA